jgi:hypothetical protein
MKPVEQASIWFGEHFAECVADHFLNGYVISKPEFFLMGKVDGDAWFVSYLAGDLRAAVASIPFPLPWVIFQRDNGELRRYSLESLTRRVHGKQTKRPIQAAAAGGSFAT